MIKKSTQESGFFNPRIFAAFLLVAVGLSIGMFSFAATPSAGTITPTTAGAVTWTGTADGTPPAVNGEGDCAANEGHTCDAYTLTISGAPADWVGKQVHLGVYWNAPSTDYDLYVHKGTLSGPVVASSASVERPRKRLI